MPERRGPAAEPRSGGSGLVWLVVTAVLLVLAVAAVSSYRDLAAQRRTEARLVAEIAATRVRIEALAARIEALKRDPVMLERLARRELGYVRPEDLVFVFPEAEAEEGTGPAKAGDPGRADDPR